MQFKISDQLSVRKIENEIFILNRKDSRLHTFNGTGAALWETMQTDGSCNALIKKLTETYNVDPPTAEKDVTDFLNELIAVHLIEQL